MGIDPPTSIKQFFTRKNTASNQLIILRKQLFVANDSLLRASGFFPADQVPSAVELPGVGGTLHVLSSIAGFLIVYCHSC